ncbi:hypothetical protein AWB69_05120 [Caballeronia udeis]|uniref:Uncharacterized protein n=1 Tax=Caballeronia udeis TaxID=1232866 RepID=A0A158I398_9BURK|nr:hypothetical protein AWB69_05120 [Caballeronia udeis]
MQGQQRLNFNSLPIRASKASMAIACLLDSRSRPHNWGTFRMANACDSWSTIGRVKRGEGPSERKAAVEKNGGLQSS